MKKVFIGIIPILVCFLLTACSVYNDIDENALEEAANKTYYVGDTVSCPQFDITLNDYIIKVKGESVGNNTIVADPEWIAVILTVKNTDDSEHTFYNSNVTLENSNGEIIKSNILSYKVWGYEGLSSPTLSSGGEKQGYIQFSNTNQDNSNLTLKISCDDKILEDNTIFKFDLN